jgi:hypothetical protein
MIEVFWNRANSGIGGFFNTSINRMPKPESFFFIAFYDTPKIGRLIVNAH